jgi:hypothetical protein
MKLVMTLVTRDAAAGLAEQLRFHLNAGVDFVIATDDGSNDDTVEVLESFAREGHLQLILEQGPVREVEQRTAMARLAATEHGADWVIDSGQDEFWWPRAESLKDAVVAIPPRYTVVQALVRRFLPAEGDGLRVVRPTFADPPGRRLEPSEWLRPVYRAGPALELVPRGVLPEPWRVPLRAWYPIEVFDFSLREGHDVGASLAGGALVSDTRLVDALAGLRETGVLALHVPDIVDDAAFAVECAALGEADFGPIEAHVAELELRMAALEARFWPSVQRALRRLLRRRG